MKKIFQSLVITILFSTTIFCQKFEFGLTDAVKDTGQKIDTEYNELQQLLPFPPGNLSAATESDTQINISWTDNSDNEDGFKIERKTGTVGTYTQLATVGANVTGYVVTDLSANTEYYFRIRAYNSAGKSGYSNEANATTKSAGTVTYTLTTNVSPSDAGTVTKNPDQTTYTAESQITLTATANSGYKFSSWSGAATGTTNPTNITMNTNKSVTATFTVSTSSPIELGKVLVPAGYFIMGSTFGAGAEPIHNVYLDAYYIDKYEVTNGQYKQFIDAGGYSNPLYWTSEGWRWKSSFNITQPYYWNNSTFGYIAANGPNLPVIMVGWYEVSAYANWAGKRLPTEAEWEKAARGTDQRMYPWGNTWNKNYCNSLESDYRKTTPVGSYENGKSPYGCYDMAGNVEEWCQDWYGTYPSGSVSNPTGSATGNMRIIRGGAHSGYYAFCISSNRGTSASPNGQGGSGTGFRCAQNFISTNTFTLTINISPTNAGTVSKNPNQTSYTAGSQVTLTATANSGYTFTSWSGDASGIVNPTNITMNANKTVTANFAVTSDTIPPAVPTLSSPSNNSTITISTPGFNWSDVTDPSGVTYELQVDNSSSFSSPEINKTGLINSNYTSTSSLSNVKYYWKVRAKDGANNYSNWTTTWSFTISVVTVPSTPSNLFATAVSSSQINLSWTDNSNNEDGFKIERKTGSGGTYAQITTVGAGATSYNNTGLTAGTTYYYRARAYNTAGDSSYSNEDNAITTVLPTYTLTINISPSGSGTVSKNPNQATYTAGSQVTLTATVNSGYTFTSWSGDATGTTNPTSVTMNSNKSVTANFTVISGTVPAGMVLVSAGNFTMGSSLSTDEQPIHTVYLDAYYIDKYEVTNGQYKQFIDAGGYNNSAYWTTDGWSWKTSNSITQPSSWTNTTLGYNATNGPNLPVVGISWYEAYAYANWAGKRLPTEAEWEKAASSDDQRTYPWGNTWDGNKCNHGVYGNPYYDESDGYKFTAPVGSYENGKSPYGCYDMVGNVWEWCNDWYDNAYYSNAAANNNPPGPSSGSYRVRRGGSWSDDSYYGDCRCANRGYDYPYDRYGILGFRCAKDP